MAVCKDQELDPEDFTLPVYTVDNYRNIYFEDFALDPIRIEDLESSISCLAPLVQKKSGGHRKNGFENLHRKKTKQINILLFMVVKIITADDAIKSQIQNQILKLSKRRKMMKILFLQTQSQLGTVLVIMIKNKVLMGKVCNISKNFMCIINKLFL